MARPASPPTTMLGVALRAKRGVRRQDDVAPEIGLPRPTVAQAERGTHAPSAETARALARWLGWTIEQVLEAAETPAPTPPTSAT